MLLLKILLVPGLVAAVTLAVRRWGPAAGGWLTGLPVVAGPVLVFYAIEQGRPFAARAAHATVTGLVATVVFCAAYARLAAVAQWYACVPIGWAAFAAALLLLHALQPPLAVSILLLVAATIGARALLPTASRVENGEDTASRAAAVAHPRGDLPLRMGASAALVVVLTGLAARLGSVWSGLLNAFPVLTTIVAAFTHAQCGRAALVAFLDAYLQAIVGFALFCGVMALAVEPLGLAAALAGALGMQGAAQALLLWGRRRS